MIWGKIMIVIVCVDAKNGMMFNHRRQSRDRVVCEDILKEARRKTLYMTVYSKGLFEKSDGIRIMESEDLLRQLKEEDICFVEDTSIIGYEEQIRTVILYQWNRHYPADTYFPLELPEGKWRLIRKEEFKGSSHEHITKEVYSR